MACRVLNIKLKLWTMDGTIYILPRCRMLYWRTVYLCVLVQLVLCCVAALSSDKLGIGNELKAAWC